MLKRREDLSLLFKQLAYKRGAEVGVLWGQFSLSMRRYWSGTFFLIDRWQHVDDWPIDQANLDPSEMERAYNHVVKIFKQDPTSIPLRATSPGAASLFPDEYLDWVYIDADHRYEAIKADLAAWWPKVAPGGILAGHDYLDTENEVFGVKTAVDEFVKANGIDPFFTTREPAAFHSWFFFKGPISARANDTLNKLSHLSW